MNKVITINDWCDGPIIGLAYYESKIVIYDRLFDATKDVWTNNYKLTPICLDDYKSIMIEWERWVSAVNNDQIRCYIGDNIIGNMLQKNKYYDSFIKKGVFYGKPDKGWIPTDYWVNWI